MTDKAILESVSEATLTILPYYKIPSPKDVSGKEYSNNVDKKTTGQTDPGQTLNWFGDGTTTDGFDYPIAGQVDAMSNSGDAFFSTVVNNQATLVFSTSFDDRIHYETPGGGGGVWATAAQIDKPGPGIDLGVTDVDGLELWGPTDANRFSVYGDPTGAVYDYNGSTITPLYTQKEIAQAIGVKDQFAHLVNLDAMMTSGRDSIMFSIDPIEQIGLDGGEIWVWNRSTSPTAQFLKHGGHLWNTAFDVMGTFKTKSENVNALEAIGGEYFLEHEDEVLPELTSEAFSLPDAGVFDPSSSESLESLEIVTAETIFSDGETSFTLDLKDEVLFLSDFIVPDFDEVSSLKSVSGKEYSNSVDKDTNGNTDPGQTLNWFGNGSTTNGFDYLISGQVDAMANSGDAFFSAVVKNQATLVFSTSFEDQIYYETPTGGNNIWATAAQIDQPGPGIDLGVTDVDGLELWGPTDANRFSVYGDYRVAVYDYDPITGNKTALYTQKEIAKAIGLGDKYDHLVNLDAMMTSGKNLIMFSIDPIEEVGLDGGEIWVWDRSSGAGAQFLKHGGHVWNTNFNVMRTFGTKSENVNALEAIGQYSGILDAGFDVVSVDSTSDIIGTEAIPLFA